MGEALELPLFVCLVPTLSLLLCLHTQTSSKETRMKHVIIYTDGSCDPNPGTGGWAAVILVAHHCKVIYGGEQRRRTTNNRMEIKAAVMELKALTRSIPVTVYTDSTHLQQGASIWLLNWVKKNKLKYRKNPDLWFELHELTSKIPVNWKWVKGHSGDKYTEIADDYASLGQIAAREGDFSIKSEWLVL